MDPANSYKSIKQSSLKLLMLDGSSKSDFLSGRVNNAVIDVWKSDNTSLTNIILNNKDVKSCVGCFDCFFKTPGVCRFQDLVQELPRTYVESDIAVFLTRVTFGGFSSILAKTYNRLVIQLESHLFEVSSGAIRRQKRYKQNYPSLLVIGLEEETDAESRDIFNALVQKNVFEHLRSPKYETLFVSEQTPVFEIKHKIDHAFKKLKG